MKPFIAAVIMVAAIIGMIMLYVTCINHDVKQQTITTVQPLDLTFTFCESCSRCISHEKLDEIVSEELTSVEEELACLI